MTTNQKKDEVQGWVYKPDKYPGPIALDATPSEECKEYHKKSCIQVNIAQPLPDCLNWCDPTSYKKEKREL